jgi:hypothetical protein
MMFLLLVLAIHAPSTLESTYVLAFTYNLSALVKVLPSCAFVQRKLKNNTSTRLHWINSLNMEPCKMGHARLHSLHIGFSTEC